MSAAAGPDSVYAAFVASAGRFAARPFLRAPATSTAAYADGAIEWSYAAARLRVDALAAGYRARGVTAGDRVAVMFDARLDVYLHLLALNALGASMVPLMSANGDSELRHILEHSDCRLAVVLDEQQARVRALGDAQAAYKVLVGADLDGAEGDFTAAAATPACEAALLYTSGTTGKPKGCMLSNEYFLALGRWYGELGGLCAIGPEDRLLTPLPPNHMNALCTSFMAMLMCGGAVIQLDRFHPREWWQTVRDERATVIHCLGVMTAILLKLPPAADENFAGRVRFNFGPGSDPRHQGAFEERFGIPIVEAWAMTESGAGGMTIAYREPRHVGKRCIGKPGEFTEVRIVDEHDVDVPRGADGELLVRARGDDPRRYFFSGYYKDDAATEAGWRGGWWHTGDVVREGDDGSLYFVDRRKNVIRRSGENIAAVEVEAALLQDDAVKNCAVCAVADEIRGDEVFAFVIPNGEADPAAIFEGAMQKLSYFKAPGYIALVDELPLTASQKLSRGKLKDMARDLLAAGRCTDLRDRKKRRTT